MNVSAFFVSRDHIGKAISIEIVCGNLAFPRQSRRAHNEAQDRRRLARVSLRDLVRTGKLLP